MTNEHCFIKALLRQPVDKTPIWIMRQAGRYLPEYRAIREKAGDFLTLCKTPELACQVTLQPLHRFDLDAAILFSDILTIPDAMGLQLSFLPGEGPCFNNPIRSSKDIERLVQPDPDTDLSYVMDTIRLVQEQLAGKHPLIGFSGSPWTLACYMVEGGSSKDFRIIKRLIYQTPQLAHRLLDRLSQAIIDYLNAQIAAGIDALMIFDTWGGILPGNTYCEFSLKYIQKIVKNLNTKLKKMQVPTIMFTKYGSPWLEEMMKTGCDALGLDWTINIGDARRRVGHRVALQGNMDPGILYGTASQIRQAVADILSSYGKGSGHVFNLGHGITADIEPDHVNILVNAVHEFSRQYHD